MYSCPLEHNQPTMKTTLTLAAVLAILPVAILVSGQSHNGSLPRLEDDDSDNLLLYHARESIAKMARQAWNAYRENAMGEPYLRPLSHKQNQSNGTSKTGETVLHSLTTFWLMNMTTEFEQAKTWIAKHWDVSKSGLWALGPLLSMHALTKESFFFRKALEVFVANSPFSERDLIENTVELLYLKKRIPDAPDIFANFTQLDEYTKQQYEREFVLHERNYHDDWWMLDRFLKNSTCFVQRILDGRMDLYRSWGYLKTTELGNLTIMASEIRKFDNSKIMEQSGCSYGALLALRHYFGNKNCPPAYEEYKYVFGVSPALFLPIAENLTETCHLALNSTNLYHLPPSQMLFDSFLNNGRPVIANGFNASFELASPYLAQSYFILYRVTRNEKYQNWARELAQSIEIHCRTPSNAYVGIAKLFNADSAKIDQQPAEFLSATLKYLYLTFAPDSWLPLYYT